MGYSFQMILVHESHQKVCQMQEMGLEDEDKATSYHTRVYIGKIFLINDG
jgi:hypothetical protein